MYPTSNGYKSAIKAQTVNYTWNGTITFADGQRISFNNENIDQNKSKITKQCVSGESLEIGTVFSSEIKLTLRDTADWKISSKSYNYYDSIVRINFVLEYKDNGQTRYETVPCGIYKITEAERTYHTVSLVAYDYASKFTKKLEDKFTDTMSPYNAIMALCLLADVEFGMTEVEVSNFPNGEIDLPMNIYKKGTSLKEILGNICTILGCNAAINRGGDLYLMQYGQISQRALTPSERYSTSYVDYVGQYTSICVVNKKGEIDTYEGFPLMPYRALTLNIGKNTLLNKVSDGQRDTIIYELMSYLGGVVYSPCNVTMPCDPSIDVGDLISVISGEIEGMYVKTLDTVVEDKQYYTIRQWEFVFDPVTPVGNENPFALGWYEEGAGVLCTKIEIPLYGQMKITSEAGSYELDTDPYVTEKEQEKQQDQNDNNDKWEDQDERNSENDEKWEEQEQHNNDTDESIGDMGEALSGLASRLAIVYVFPYATNAGTISDGGSAEVLRFKFNCERENESVSFHSEISFVVSTTVSELAYGDCNLTVNYILDNEVVNTAMHTYGDGKAILTLNGCFTEMAQGDHLFDVQFAVSGGSIS